MYVKSRKKKIKFFLGLGLIFSGILLLVFWTTQKITQPVLSLPRVLQNIDDELGVGKACTIKDEKGNLVTMISRRVRVGDEVINAEGKHYRVQKVYGNTAAARFMGMDKDLLAYNELFSKMELPAAAPAGNKRPVVIYHTQ